MTRDEIMRLEGRELDIALGKSLGWRWYSRPYVLGEAHERYLVFTNDPTRVDVPEDDPRLADIKHWEGKDGKLALSEVPPLSTTWEGMRLVVEAMRAKGWRMRLETFEDSVDAEFYFPALINSEGWLERDSKHFRATADDAPRAVALAALLAMEGA